MKVDEVRNVLTNIISVRYHVHMKTTIPATRVRSQFFKLIEATDQPGRSITITVDGEPKVVMMSVTDFEGWQETLEVVSDKMLMKGIQKGLQDVKNGKIHSAADVKKALKLK